MNFRDEALTIDQLDGVAGGARVEVGPVYVDLQKGELSLGVKGAFDVTVFGDGGICVHVGGRNGVGGCT